MLPPGHVAGGYLITKALTKILPYEFTQKQLRKLCRLGMFMGFAPDLDLFYAFYKSGGFTIDRGTTDHRTYLTHTPLFWLVVGLVIFTSSKNKFTKAVGIVIWLGAWSHLILDSLEHGVRWLWPLTDKLYALKPAVHSVIDIQTSDFLPYWTHFVTWYLTHSITFYFEILIIIAAIIIAMKSKPFRYEVRASR